MLARVEAGKVTPKILSVGVEAAKVAQRIGIIPKWGTNYTLFCDLGRVRAEPGKTCRKISADLPHFDSHE